MESRSGHGRQGGPAPPRRRPNPKPQSYINDGVDRISGLPDHLLEEILRRIRCARSAARTSLLSRRWRHALWRGLPELSFRGIAAGALSVALAQVARPDLSLLDIHSVSCFEVAGIASLLRAAARLAPAELVVSADLLEAWPGGHFIPFELQLPCFHRANSITLEMRHHIPQLRVTGGEFPVLERLSLVDCPVHNISDLISRAPRLRSLQLCHRLYHTTCPGKIMVHSTTLEELLLDRWELFGGIDIVAPALRTFTLTSSRLLGIHVVAPELKMFTLSARIVSNHPRITLSAAATVEYLSWTCSFPMTPLIHGVWCLRELKLGEKKDAYVLSLTLDGERTAEQPRNLQEVVQLPRVSVLELYLHTFWPEAHVYGPMVLDLMGIFADIKRLKLVIRDLKLEKACLPNCTCAQPQNWRSQSISLIALEVVEIENFIGSSHEVDFLKLVFRSAPMMKRVTVKQCSHTVPSFRACKEICNLFRGHPSVKCYSYDSCGKKVLYPLSTYASRCRGR